jgi:hypothetical protein
VFKTSIKVPLLGLPPAPPDFPSPGVRGRFKLSSGPLVGDTSPSKRRSAIETSGNRRPIHRRMPHDGVHENPTLCKSTKCHLRPARRSSIRTNSSDELSPTWQTVSGVAKPRPARAGARARAAAKARGNPAKRASQSIGRPFRPFLLREEKLSGKGVLVVVLSERRLNP